MEENTRNTTSDPLVQGEDFYIEGGLYVFTDKYLLKRGFCCKNGCRHCPYGFKKEMMNSEKKM